MTSNVGSELLGPLTKGEITPQQADAEQERMLRTHFRPEFLNRLDGQLQFHPLRREHMLGILEVQLRRIDKRIAERELELDVSEDAKKWLAETGYDPDFGARPLKRLLQRTILEPLSERILAGEYGPGARVLVRLDGDALVLH